MKRIVKYLYNWWKGNTCTNCIHWGKATWFDLHFCNKKKYCKAPDSTCAYWKQRKGNKL